MSTNTTTNPKASSLGATPGPELVKSERVLGASVMAGIYEDGHVEVLISELSPVNPTDAGKGTHAMESYLLDLVEGAQ